MYIFEINDEDTPIISFFGKTFSECFEQFEEAKIFDGKTIYEIESEVEVIYS